MTTLLIAMVLVAIAEFGDKTQMLTLMLAARHGARKVLLGVAIAIMGLQLLAVAGGGLVSALIPENVMAWITAVLFVGFGVWTLRGSDEEDAPEGEPERARKGGVLGTAGAFFIAELGDKTQIMTMAIAADPGAALRSLGTIADGVRVPEVGPWTLAAVWVGSTLGMLLVNGAAALVGTAVGSKLRPDMVRRVSGVIFILFGVIALVPVLF